jgi:putative glutamine amidotransferase
MISLQRPQHSLTDDIYTTSTMKEAAQGGLKTQPATSPDTGLAHCYLPSLGAKGIFFTGDGLTENYPTATTLAPKTMPHKTMPHKTTPHKMDEFLASSKCYGTPGRMTAEDVMVEVPIEPLEAAPDPTIPTTPAKPTIGILFSEWSQLSHSSMADLIKLVKAHACEPTLIFPIADALLPEDQLVRQHAVQGLTEQLDGLIALGGPDIDPNTYGEHNTHCVRVNKRRDRFDAALLLSAALNPKLYLLAICRSHQLLTAVLGGALLQDMRNAGKSKISRDQRDYQLPDDGLFELKDNEGKRQFAHTIDIDPKSDFGRIIGEKQLVTNSFHHQVVSDTNDALAVAATLEDPDCKLRNIEVLESWHITSTQFHPERLLRHEPFEKITGTVCRRAHIFHRHKVRPQDTSEHTTNWMKEYQEGKPFLSADFDWYRDHQDRIIP